MDEQEKAEFRAQLEEKHGTVFDTSEVQKEFNIESFGYGFAFGTRRSTGEKTTLDFTHSPRFYWVS